MRSMTEVVARSLGDPRGALKELDRIDAERSLHEFIRQGWHALEPSNPFVDGWALRTMCEHLEAVSDGRIKRLLINVPPGCTKSMTVSVFWPAWEWARNPSLRYINASYNAELAIRDNLRCRDLIQSEWYQENWGSKFLFKGDQNAKIKYENTQHGWKFACGVGAGLTGHRGDRIIVDDPHSVQGADSEADRETALRWFSETLPTRLNKIDESAIVVIMQRVHERDVSGLIIDPEKELKYDRLILPMEYEPDHPYKSSSPLGFVDPRKELGELLWPERFTAKGLAQLKASLRSWGGSYAEAGQLQQRPSPRGGGMFQRKDFAILDTCPEFVRVVRGWDLAGSKDKRAAWSVGVKIGKTKGGQYVIADVRRLRGSPREVEQAAVSCAELDGGRVQHSFPQDPGQAGLAQKAYIGAALAGHDIHFSPETGSKEDRARPFAAQCEAGNVAIVRGTWNDAFLNEACLFPNGEFKDQVDAASRAFARIIQKRLPEVGAAPQTV